MVNQPKLTVPCSQSNHHHFFFLFISFFLFVFCPFFLLLLHFSSAPSFTFPFTSLHILPPHTLSPLPLIQTIIPLLTSI